MLNFTKGTNAVMYLTLTERQTITDANWLFVFESRTTNDKVKFVIANASDQSQFKDRFNQFTITVDTYFGTKEEGWYKVTIYEQASAVNTDESSAGAIVEQGLMFLSDGTDVSYNKFNNTTNYKVYDAE